MNNITAAGAVDREFYNGFYGIVIFCLGFWAPGGVPAARPQNSALDGLRESPGWFLKAPIRHRDNYAFCCKSTIIYILERASAHFSHFSKSKIFKTILIFHFIRKLRNGISSLMVSVSRNSAYREPSYTSESFQTLHFKQFHGRWFFLFFEESHFEDYL